VSEPQPPPDWDSIFHRGRRQIFSRILVVGAVAAVGALVLLGGGLSAHKTGFLRGLGQENDAKSDPPPKKQKHHEGKPPGKSGNKDDHSSNHGGHHKSNDRSSQSHQKHSPGERCEGDSAASQEYCDAGSSPETESTSGIGEKSA